MADFDIDNLIAISREDDIKNLKKTLVILCITSLGGGLISLVLLLVNDFISKDLNIYVGILWIVIGVDQIALYLFVGVDHYYGNFDDSYLIAVGLTLGVMIIPYSLGFIIVKLGGYKYPYSIFRDYEP